MCLAPRSVHCKTTRTRYLANVYLRHRSKVRGHISSSSLSFARQHTQSRWPKGTLGLTRKPERSFSPSSCVDRKTTHPRPLVRGYLRLHSKVRARLFLLLSCQSHDNTPKVFGPRAPESSLKSQSVLVLPPPPLSWVKPKDLGCILLRFTEGGGKGG